MFALYCLGKGITKTVKSAAKKTGSVAKKVVKKSGTAVKKTILPSKPKPAVKQTVKPTVKTAVPLVKVVSKKPVTKKTTQKAVTAAAKKTLKKAAANIAAKKGKAASSFLPTQTAKQAVQKQIEEITQKTQPSIFPDVPAAPAVVPEPITATPTNPKAALMIAGGIGLAVILLMGKKR